MRISYVRGAIDGTHVPIIAPADSNIEYVSRKGCHSIVMQAVTDCNYMFRSVIIGWPGSVRDTRILSNSTIFTKGSEKRLFPNDLVNKNWRSRNSTLSLGRPSLPSLTIIDRGISQ